MMGRVFAIALNTFREAVRNKVLYGILGLVGFVYAMAVILGTMSLAEEARIARDIGLAGLAFSGALTAIVLGGMLLYTEVQRRTIQVVLAKPIERYEFVLGKYLGMAAMLSVLVVAFAIALAVMLHFARAPFDENMAKGVLLAWLGILVVAAVAIFFSSFSSFFLAGLFTLGVWIIGRSSAELRYAAEKSKEPAIRSIGEIALYVVPDLHLYAASGSEVDGAHVSVHGDFVSWSYVGHAALYAAAVVAALLILSMLIFGRRDFA